MLVSKRPVALNVPVKEPVKPTDVYRVEAVPARRALMRALSGKKIPDSKVAQAAKEQIIACCTDGVLSRAHRHTAGVIVEVPAELHYVQHVLKEAFNG